MQTCPTASPCAACTKAPATPTCSASTPIAASSSLKSVLGERDGPTLKHSIQALHRQDLWVPSFPADHPNRDWLELRWQRFNEANNP